MQIRYRQNRCKILRIAACHLKKNGDTNSHYARKICKIDAKFWELLPVILKKTGTQIVITHAISASDLPPIEKNFYIEDPDVPNLDLDEVEDLR